VIFSFGAALLWPAVLVAQEDENGVSMLTRPAYTKEQVIKAAAEIPPVKIGIPRIISNGH
jgi:hypothetical protein